MGNDKSMSEEAMTPIDWKVESQRFDGVAGLYDTYRPSYPAELVEDIILLSGIRPEGRILEIGSGTGKATLLFAQRGYTILCLEPGQNLIEVARENLKSYPDVSFIRARFEEWKADQSKFELVISAQAFHWVPEQVRYEKTAAVLKQDGHLAVFWNMYPGIEGKIRQELDQVYSKRAPELVKPETPVEQLIESRANSLRESAYFKQVVVRRYPWSTRYETKEYLGLLNTYSDHLRLTEQRRRVLFEEIAETIERHGGYIERPYLAVVYMAQRTSA
jgi:ubiquinone/menaquinone biosynthesis C-methylase UbiE